jgi:hypothetical protein
MRAASVLCVVLGCSDPQPEAPPRRAPVTVANKPLLADAGVDAAPPVHPIFAELEARTGSYAPADTPVELVPYRDRDQWGYADRSMKIVIEPRFAAAKPFSMGRAVVWIGGQCAHIDSTGQEVTPLRFDGCKDFDSTHAAVHVPEQGWLVVDMNGRPINHELYDDVAPGVAHDGIIVVQRGRDLMKGVKYGFIGVDGKPRTEIVYDLYALPAEGLIPVRTGDRWGVIDYAGKPVLPAEYDDFESFSHGVATAERAGMEGVIDRTGKPIVPFEFETIYGGGDLFVAQRSHDSPPSLVFDRTGTQIASIPFVVDRFTEDLAPFKRDGKYGFVDRSGKIVVAARYEEVSEFRDGLATVKSRGRYGLIDRKGTGVIAMFKDVIRSTNVPAFPNVVRFVEQSVLVHEGAHAIGLVDNGVKLASQHKDAEHGAHCTNDRCVMYWLNEGATDAAQFARMYVISGESILFDAACLGDVDALTGGPP